jgi:site-specific recombinase XerD
VKNRKKTERGNSLRFKFLSNSQVGKLLQYVKNKADDDRRKGNTRSIVNELIIMLFVDTGIHAKELCNLSISDLPLCHGENAIWIRDDKGNVVRSVEINSKMSECLEKFVRLYRKSENHNEPLIINERGNRISYMSLYSKVRKIGEKAGIGRLHPHILRSTYLVRLYNKNNDLRFVQEQAGHANRKTTALYTKMANELLQDEAARDKASSAVQETCVSKGRSTTDKTIFQKTINDKEIDQLDDSHQSIICEACNNQILVGNGKKIDSGQILCDDCLREIRSKYPSHNS